ncbi:MAG: STAS domain-containing protein [Planctomycetes bacterium]|nr:STAS domain-containing protein [Planctomycetota bacterium]
MSQVARATYRVSSIDGAIYIRVEGMASMATASTLKSFADRMVREGHRRFIVDLGPCTGMDSTFMGTLMSLVQQLEGTDGPGVLIANASADCLALLENIGLTRFVRLAERLSVPADLELQTLEPGDLSGPQRLRFIKEVHENLVRIDRRNQERFGAFIRALDREFSASR